MPAIHEPIERYSTLAKSTAWAGSASTRRKRVTTPYRIPFFWIVQTGSVHRRQSAPTNHFAASVLPFNW